MHGFLFFFLVRFFGLLEWGIKDDSGCYKDVCYMNMW